MFRHLIVCAAMALGCAASPAIAQTDACYELPGKAADYVFTPGPLATFVNPPRPTWYVKRAPGSTVPVPTSLRIADKCFFFRHEPWDMASGRPVLRSGGVAAPGADQATYDRGFNDAVGRVFVPPRR